MDAYPDGLFFGYKRGSTDRLACDVIRMAVTCAERAGDARLSLSNDSGGYRSVRATLRRARFLAGVAIEDGEGGGRPLSHRLEGLAETGGLFVRVEEVEPLTEMVAALPQRARSYHDGQGHPTVGSAPDVLGLLQNAQADLAIEAAA